MKFLRAALSALIVLTFHFAQAQYTETEGNDDFPNANDVIVNSQATIDGVLGSGGDHYDYFRVSVTEYSTIEVSYSSTPGYSMLIGLYNADTDGLAVMPSFSQTGADSVSFECAVAGTYYVLIRDYIFNSTALPYTVTVDLVNPLSGNFIDPEYNDEKDSAQWISLQPTIIPNTSQANIGGNLRYRFSPGAQETDDWYKFVITSPGAVSAVSATNSTFYSALLSSDHGSIAQDLFFNEAAFCLEPDTYFLRFNTSSVGGCFDYSMVLRHEAVFNSSQENEPNNDIPNADYFSQDMYARIGYNSYDQSGVGTEDDRDFFRLITEEDGDLIIDIEPDSTFLPYSASLYSDVSNNFLPINTTGNSNQGDTIQIRLNCAQADTFYLRILNAGFCGNYHVKYHVEAEDLGNGTNEIEPNDNISQAQDISSESAVISTIAHTDYSNAPSYGYDDLDFFRITPNEEGTLWVATIPETGGFLFPTLTLLDSLGNELAFEANDTIRLECVGKVPYFVSVDATCDHYRLEWGIDSDFGTDEEPNDMLNQASDFPIATSMSSIEGRLGALQPTEMFDTYDYYKVMMSTSGNTKLWFTSEDGNGTLDIWSAAGDLRSSHQATLTDSVEIDLGCLALDTFYISVSSTSCFGYRVSAQIETFLGTPDPEPNDNISEAIVLTETTQSWGVLGGEIISESSLGDTRDYYKLILEDHGTFSVNVNTVFADNTPLVVQLLATDGATAIRSDTLWNQGLVDYNYTCMQPDTLYLQVKPMLVGIECQVYTMWIQMSNSFPFANPDQEPNDNESSAIQLANGQAAEGLVGFFRYGTADMDAADYYSFNAIPGFMGISFNTYETLDSVRVTVYSQSEPNLLQFDGNDLLPGGTYLNSFDVG